MACCLGGNDKGLFEFLIEFRKLKFSFSILSIFGQQGVGPPPPPVPLLIPSVSSLPAEPPQM